MFAKDVGAAARVTFEGSGVMLLGCLTQAGGRLKIQLDDRPSTVVETFLFARGLMPHVMPQEALWYSGPIPRGPHTLQIELLRDSHPDSEGRLVGVQGIVVYESNQTASGSNGVGTSPPPEARNRPAVP